MAYSYNRIIFSHKKEENLVIYYNTDESGRHYTKKISVTKDKYCMIPFI